MSSTWASWSRSNGASRSAWSWALAAGLVTVVLATSILTFSDGVPRRLQLLLWRLDVPDWMTANTVMKIGHFVTWAVIAAVAAAIPRRPRTALLATVAVASLVTEVLQNRLTDSRVTNPVDAAVNLAGIFVGWAAVRTASNILHHGPRPDHEPY